MLGMALPGNAGITVTRWVDQVRTATKAHKAEDSAKRAADDAITAKRVACYNAISTAAGKGEIPTASDFERCSKIGVEETSGFRWSTPSKQPEEDERAPKAASKPAPVATATLTASQQCNHLALEAEYAPGQVKGPLAIGELTRGRYRIVVTGTINQLFLKGDVPDQYCPVEPNGNIGNCVGTDGRTRHNIPGTPWPTPQPTGTEAPATLVGQPYGAPVLHAFGKPLLVNREIYLDVEEQTALSADSNVFRNPLNYTAEGVRKYKIYRCS